MKQVVALSFSLPAKGRPASSGGCRPWRSWSAYTLRLHQKL